MTDIDQANIKLFVETNDTDAFERLLVKYQDQVYNYCYRYLGNEADASDCTQEIFIRLFENLKSFRFESKFSTWLFRVTLNTCKNMAGSKSYRMEQQAVRNVIAEQAPNSKYQIPNNNSNPEILIQAKELNQLLQNAIDKLKGKQKTVLILRDLDGHSYEEIVSITGLNIGTVRSTLNRARLKIAGIISKNLER